MNRLMVCFLLFLTTSGYAVAKDDGADAAIRAQLAAKLPNLKVESIAPSVVSGMYEVVVEGSIFYISADGRYVLVGDLTDMETGANLTEQRRSEARLQLLSTIDEKQMISFNSDKSKYKVVVFTDIDCGYCRKLHSEIAGYNALGIDIQYMFYPRSGLGGESYKKAVSVWCADDRKQAMTDAKQGKALPEKTCENPVAEQYLLGEKFGLRGTPALILENGQMLPGYMPPVKLLQALTEELGVR